MYTIPALFHFPKNQESEIYHKGSIHSQAVQSQNTRIRILPNNPNLRHWRPQCIPKRKSRSKGISAAVVVVVVVVKWCTPPPTTTNDNEESFYPPSIHPSVRPSIYPSYPSLPIPSHPSLPIPSHPIPFLSVPSLSFLSFPFLSFGSASGWLPGNQLLGAPSIAKPTYPTYAIPSFLAHQQRRCVGGRLHNVEELLTGLACSPIR